MDHLPEVTSHVDKPAQRVVVTTEDVRHTMCKLVHATLYQVRLHAKTTLSGGLILSKRHPTSDANRKDEEGGVILATTSRYELACSSLRAVWASVKLSTRTARTMFIMMKPARKAHEMK